MNTADFCTHSSAYSEITDLWRGGARGAEAPPAPPPRPGAPARAETPNKTVNVKRLHFID